MYIAFKILFPNNKLGRTRVFYCHFRSPLSLSGIYFIHRYDMMLYEPSNKLLMI